jgi:hypothetical protein
LTPASVVAAVSLLLQQSGFSHVAGSHLAGLQSVGSQPGCFATAVSQQADALTVFPAQPTTSVFAFFNSFDELVALTINTMANIETNTAAVLIRILFICLGFNVVYFLKSG